MGLKGKLGGTIKGSSIMRMSLDLTSSTAGKYRKVILREES